MERLIIEKSKSISADKVDFFEGIVSVYNGNSLIGSVIPVVQGGQSVRMVTLYEDNVFNSLNDVIDSFFDYEFKYITE